MKALLSIAIALLVGACGGGGSSAPAAPAAKPLFPPYTSHRSDFIDRTEGSAANPMKVALPPCVILPPAEWQTWLCSMAQALPTVYAATNSFSTAADPHYAWIISVNNEFLQTPGCNTGPPNQSLGPNDYPFTMIASPASLKLQVTHDARPFCDKIPYLSAAYLRGVQGDPQARLFGWRELAGKSLEIEVETHRAADTLSWFRVLTHFRDPRTGQRYFVNKDYIAPDTLPDFWFNWNWPYRSSFQYPGAKIAIPARVPSQSLGNGTHRITIDVARQALQYFPEFAGSEPDFLGIEIAVEQGPVINTTAVTIRSVAMK